MATVADILAQKGSAVATVTPESTVFDAVCIMADQRIGSVVVTSAGRVVGIFTERDVLNRVVAVKVDPQSLTVGEAMSSPVACCQPETRVPECKAVMSDKKLRHLPVVKDGELVGMVSVGDIMAREVTDQTTTIQYLQDYIHGRV